MPLRAYPQLRLERIFYCPLMETLFYDAVAYVLINFLLHVSKHMV